ncbi:MAG: 4-hydroxy-3-methylbut-2-enyl diphosphate reductase, partial [Alphaproteobacteria bacterium]
WLDGVKAVGITAGASAPEELVEEVIDRLRALRSIEVTELVGVEENVQFRLPAELADDAADTAAPTAVPSN